MKRSRSSSDDESIPDPNLPGPSSRSLVKPNARLLCKFAGPPPRKPFPWRPITTKQDDLRGVITNLKLEKYAMGSVRRSFGEIIRFDVIGDLNKDNPEPRPGFGEFDPNSYGCVIIDRRKSQKQIVLEFPLGPTINLIKANNLFPNWRIEPGFGLSERIAVEVFREATEELASKRNDLSDDLQMFLQSMERHDENKYLFQCNHLSCLFLTFGVATDEDAAIICELIPNTTFCFFQHNMIPNDYEIQHNVSYGTRLTKEMYKELTCWMKIRLNIAIAAPIKYILRRESPLKLMNVLFNVDSSIFACCQRMRHYTASLAVASGTNLHQGNLLLLKHMDNAFTFGKDRVMKKYLENVRRYSQAYTEEMRLINTEIIYELINILDKIAASYHFPNLSEADALTLVAVGNSSRRSTIRLGRFSCDKCNLVCENLSELIKHYTLREYILNKKFQCQLCTRSRCTKNDLKKHLLEQHNAKNIGGRLVDAEGGDVIPQKHSGLIELTEEEAMHGYDETRIRVVQKEDFGTEQLNQVVAEINNQPNLHIYIEESSDEEFIQSVSHAIKSRRDTQSPDRGINEDDNCSEQEDDSGTGLIADHNLNVDGSNDVLLPENAKNKQQLKKSLLLVDTISLDLTSKASRSTIDQIKQVLTNTINDTQKPDLKKRLEGSLKIFDSIRPNLSSNTAAEVLNHLKNVLSDAIDALNIADLSDSSSDNSISTIDVETSIDSAERSTVQDM